jgi:hypothetical protein
MKRIYSVLLLISIASFSQEIALVNIVVVGIGMPNEAAHENAQRHRQLLCHGRRLTG